MAPLTNTRMIPEGWSQHHQPAVETAMRSRFDQLLPRDEIPDPSPWDPNPEDRPSDVVAPNVPCRIYAMRHDNEQAPSGQTADTQQYRIQYPATRELDIKVGRARLRVTSNPNAPEIEGRVFTVDAVLRGSEMFNVDLVVSEHVTQQQG